MWIDIKGRYYNLDHYHKIVKIIDECESYKEYCIKMYLKNGTKTEYALISFKDKESRNNAFDFIHIKIIEVVIK